MEFALASRTGGVPRVLDRRISNAGRIADIRKRDPQQIFTSGGIPKYSTLGSQNAISFVPIAFPTKSTGTQTDKEKKDSGTDARPLLGKTQSEESKEKMREGLLGTTQSQESRTAMGVRKAIEDEKARDKEAKDKEDAEKNSAVEPNEKPPFDLSNPEGKKAMEQYDAYVVKRYGENAGNLKSDEVKTESEGFTASLNAWRSINKQITAFNRDDMRRWSEWANNTFKKYGDQIIEALSYGANTLYPGSKELIDDIKGLAKSFKPSDEKDFVKSMKELQAKLFEGRPEWKKKLNEIAVVSWVKFMEKYKDVFDVDDGGTEGFMPVKKNGLKSTKKEEAPEPKAEPKKRKLRKTVAIKI